MSFAIYFTRQEEDMHFMRSLFMAFVAMLIVVPLAGAKDLAVKFIDTGPSWTLVDINLASRGLVEGNHSAALHDDAGGGLSASAAVWTLASSGSLFSDSSVTIDSHTNNNGQKGVSGVLATATGSPGPPTNGVLESTDVEIVALTAVFLS